MTAHPVDTSSAKQKLAAPSERTGERPSIKHRAKKTSKIGHKRSIVYVRRSPSYTEGVERRSSPPSKKTNNKPKERLSERMAGAIVDPQRQRLIALMTRASQETMRELLPLVEDVIARSEPKPPCAKQVLAVKPLAGNFDAAGKQCAERRLRNGKLELPKLPSGLKWPRKKYAVAHRRDGVSICEFLRAEWKPLIDAGFGELRWLRRKDATAARAIDKFERVNAKTNERQRLPADIHFLRESEATNLRAAHGVDGRDARLLGALAGRARRGRPVELS